MPSTILHHPSWGRTVAGKPLELWASEHGSDRPVLFVGGVHGDEPEGVRLAEDLLAWLKNNDGPHLHSWIVVPCLNLDGFTKNERTNANGVDLNRNFPTSDWSPESKGPRYFPGTRPASEPEVKALVELIERKNPRLIIHFHSWEPCVVYTGAMGRRAAEILSPGPAYEVREDIGYPTPGSLGQYGWLQRQTPVICIEENDQLHDHDAIWTRFGPGLRRLLEKDTQLT